jgi:hypothetical protein
MQPQCARPRLGRFARAHKGVFVLLLLLLLCRRRRRRRRHPSLVRAHLRFYCKDSSRRLAE